MIFPAAVEKIEQKLERMFSSYCMRFTVTGAHKRGERTDLLEVVMEPLLDLSGDVPIFEVLRQSKELRRISGAAKDDRQTYRLKNPEMDVGITIVRPPSQFGILSLLRTGPEKYASGLMLSVRLLRNPKRGHPELGWVVSRGALWEAKVCAACQGKDRKCRDCKGFGTRPCFEKPVPVPTEESFYKVTKREYIPPEVRGKGLRLRP